MFKSPHVRWFYHAIVLLLMSASAHSSDLTLITRYGDTGGLAGNLNNVGDQINGRNICTVANDYTNVAPGCDMGADPGYVANGPGADDDTYNGDLIVRTNDEFEVIAAYSWLGNAGGSEERVTITGVLPAGTGFIWSQIPGSCDVGLSSISVDQKTIVCVRVDFDPFDVGSFAEDFSLPVRVEGDAINGSTPGDIVVTIDAPDSANGSGPITDGVEDGTAANLIKVTASPRWNIDKSGGAGYYTLQAGRQDDLANPGWWIWYNFTIEVDEVNGETDSAINPLLGNEALLGGTNATVSFTDDLSAISPNAKIVTWDTNGNYDPVANACTMEVYTNSDEPFPSFNAANPERSIQVEAGGIGVGMDVTCTQVGTAVNVVVSGMDGTLSKAPRRNRNGGFLPVNRSIAAIGTMRVFVPLSDVVNAGGTLNTTNCFTDFNPLGISGGANFAGAGESEVDNCRNLTLNAAAGSWDKNFRKGWSDRADQIAQWGGGGWSLPPTDASVVEGGDGTITPGGVFGTYTVYNNTGGSDIANPTLCDVIDVETYEMTLLDPLTDDASTFVDDRIHAVDLNYSTTESVPGLIIEYATGYVGSWPPNPFEAPSANAPDEVVAECSDPGITWYPDLVTAETTDGAPVSKVRISAPTLPPGIIMAMRIKHTARADLLTSGLPIPNNTILVNHATYRSALTNNNYRAGDYFPRDASLSPGNASGGGDRLIMVRAKARIIKSMNPTNVSPGSESTVTLMTSFTTDGGGVPETDNVIIADLLPNGLNYKNGTTTGTYDGGTLYGEPVVISPVTDLDCNTHVPDIVSEGHPCGTLNGGTGNESILVWDLGPVVTGTVMGDLDFITFVGISAPSGTLQNYAQISSPADTSESSKRVSNANVNNSVPSSLLIVKEVLTPLHEVNTDPLLNWMQFRVGVRNGSSGALTDLDVIDILPFNGDGVSGSFTFSPSPTVTVNRQRLPATSYNGDFEFDSLSFDDNGGVCSGAIEFWFTDETGTLDISPVNPANVIPTGAVNWCQGTATGPAGACGFTNTEVTAVRARGASMNPAATCYLNVTYATSNNIDEDIYSNTAGAKATGVTNAVLSNTVLAVVFAGSIGDTIWHDINNDGMVDVGEPLAGITVSITPPPGVNLGNGLGVTITDVTDINGNYLFDNLPAGEYTVAVVESTLPIGLQGSNTVDPDGGNDSTAVYNLGDDEDNLDQDFAYYAPGSIGDTIWFDMNDDGVVDAGEALPTITVTLTPPAGVDLGNGPGVAISTTTDANGNYLFPNLPPGNYTVTVDESTLPVALQGNNSIDPDGGNNSTSAVTLAAGENNLDQDFAYFVPGSIGDTIYNDQNNDGIIDAGEGIPNVVVTLTPPANIDLGNGPGNPITTTTDGNGNYNFGDLPPGDYVVTVDESTLPPALQGNNTQDPDGGNNSTSNVSLGQGENNPDQDFGYFTSGAIGDTVWFDINNDGVYFIDEGLANVTVTLTPPAGIDLGNGPGNPISTTTDANGNYLFDNLPAGQYTVTIDQSTLPQILQVPGANTVDPDGGSDSTSVTTITAGGSDLDQDFAYYLPVAINLEKTVYATHNSGASCPGSELVQGAAGNEVTYCFEVTNTGQTYLDNVAITDTDISVTQSDLTLLVGILPLAPGDSISYYYDATMTTSLLNTAQVVGIPTDSNGDVLPGNSNPVDFDTAEVEVVGPGIGLDKSVYLNHDAGASCATATDAVSIYANTPVTYCFVVTNTGNTFLGDIELNDATLGIDETDMTLLSGTLPLAQNAQAVYYYQTTATTDLVNTADVVANPVDSLGDDIVGLPDVSDNDIATVSLQIPEMTLNKSVYAGVNGGAGCPGTGSLNLTAPSDVTFCFIVTNTGQVDLDDVMVNDITFAVTDADMVLVFGTLPLEPNDSIIWAYETSLSEGVNNEAIATANPVDETGTDIPPLIDEEDNDVAIVTIGAPVTVPVPALSQWTLLLMALLMVGMVFRRRQI